MPWQEDARQTVIGFKSQYWQRIWLHKVQVHLHDDLAVEFVRKIRIRYISNKLVKVYL